MTAPTVTTRHQGRACALYAAYQGATIIYIGISNHPDRRFRQHTTKPWAGEVTHWRVLQWFPTEPAARTAETTMIQALRPRWNLDQNPDWRLVLNRYRDYGVDLSRNPTPPPHRPLITLLRTLLRLVGWFLSFTAGFILAVAVFTVTLLAGGHPPRRHRTRRKHRR